MKRKNEKNKSLIVLVFFTIALLSTFIMPSANNALASGGNLEIAGPNKILASEEYVEFSATLINSSYGLESIEWFYNEDSISQIYYSEGTTTHTSILKLERSFYENSFNDEKLSASAKISARITVGSTQIYNSEKTVVIESDIYSVKIEVDNESQEFNEAGEYEPFLFKVSGLSPPTENVTWFLLEDYGKYNPLSPPFNDSYSLSVHKSGTYTVVAKVGNHFSNKKTVTVKYKPILPAEFLLTHKVVGKNSLGLNIYELTLNNLTEEHDLSNINWYRRGFSTPLQYGGDTFLFEPTAYATYQIYARYESPESNNPNQLQGPESNVFTEEFKINRTKDIIIFSSIILGVMAVGLVFLIYRNIKKDKIW